MHTTSIFHAHRSLASAVAAAVVLVAISVGSTPATLSAQVTNGPRDLGAQVAGAMVTLSWRPPANSATVTGYVVQAGTSPGATSVSLPLGNVLTVSVNAPPGIYYVRVVSVGASGALSASDEIQVAVGAGGLPAAPLSLVPTVSGGSVSLRWNPNASGAAPSFYQLQAGTAPGLSNIAVSTLPASPRSFSTIAPPGTYYVRVLAGNAAGLSRRRTR